MIAVAEPLSPERAIERSQSCIAEIFDSRGWWKERAGIFEAALAAKDEEIAELQKNLFEMCTLVHKYQDQLWTKDKAEAELNSLRGEREWIAVEDRLPAIKEGCSYLQ